MDDDAHYIKIMVGILVGFIIITSSIGYLLFGGWKGIIGGPIITFIAMSVGSWVSGIYKK